MASTPRRVPTIGEIHRRLSSGHSKWVVGLASVASALGGAAILEIVHSLMAQGFTVWSQQTTFWLALLFVTSVINVLLLSMIFQQQSDIRERVSMEIRYLGREDYPLPEILSSVQKFIQRSRESIVIVNAPVTEVYPPEDRAGLAEYFDSLIEFASDHQREYKRLVQVPTGSSFARLLPDSCYVEHFTKMAAPPVGKEASVALYPCDAFWMMTFALGDEERLVIQVNRCTSETQCEIDGVFLIYDPRRTITPLFRSLIRKLDANRGHRVKPSDITESLGNHRMPPVVVPATHAQMADQVGGTLTNAPIAPMPSDQAESGNTR